MQKPNIILSMLNQRSIKGYSIDHIYRYLYNPELYINIYKQLSNDNKIESKYIRYIDSIIKELKEEKYYWNNNKFKLNAIKSLTISEWKDKILEEVLYTILKNIYEPKFLDSSNAYRDNKNISTALSNIYLHGQACEYFIVCKYEDFFKNFDSTTFIKIFSNTIKDNRFIELIKRFLKTYPIESMCIFDKTHSKQPIVNKLYSLLKAVVVRILAYLSKPFLVSFIP